MQLSAANLLIAAQQAASRQAPQPKANQFAAALATEAKKEALFAPLDFKQTAEPAAPARPQAASSPATRPGAMLDIRV